MLYHIQLLTTFFPLSTIRQSFCMHILFNNTVGYKKVLVSLSLCNLNINQSIHYIYTEEIEFIIIFLISISVQPYDVHLSIS